MKKSRFAVCLMAMLSLAWISTPVRADQSPIAPFVDSQTNAVVYINLAGVDLTQVDQWRKKAVDSSNLDQAEKDRENAQSKTRLDQARKWIEKFKAAGGKDVYIVVSLGGMMQGQFGAILTPLGNGANSDALAKVFNPAGNTPPPADDTNQPTMMQPATTVIGNMLVYSTAAEVNKLQTPSSEARPDLSDALAAGGDATVRIALSPKDIRSQPMLAAMMRRGQQHPPFSEPEWDNVKWVSIAFSTPPQESGKVTCECKDPDGAKNLAAMMNHKIQDAQNDPKAKQSFGDDLGKLTTLLQPTVDGTKVIISANQDAMDNIIGPAIIRAGQRQRQQRAQQQGQQQGGPADQAPPQNNGGGF